MKKMLAALAVTATLLAACEAAAPAQATGTAQATSTIVWENHKARVTEVVSPYEICDGVCVTYTNFAWTFSSKLAWGVRLLVECRFTVHRPPDARGETARKGYGTIVKKGHPSTYNTVAPTPHHFTGFANIVSTSDWSCTAKRI